MKENANKKKKHRRKLTTGDRMCLWIYFVGICMTWMLAGNTNNQRVILPSYGNNEMIFYNTTRLGTKYNVSFTPRGFVIDGGKPSLLLGGSIHYARMTPSLWRPILQKARDDGLNVVSTYVFWNGHQPTSNGEWISGEQYDLVKFIKTAAEVGLFINLRIGPYVCAEWNNGGLPVWLGNIKTRTNDRRWKEEMKLVVEKVVTLVSPYVASTNGGNIILAQIENEYQREGEEAYVEWCGDLTKVIRNIPWIMCNGKSANDTIGSCNDNDCYEFSLKHTREYPTEPLVWTENEGWFQEYVSQQHYIHNSDRKATEISYAVLRFIAIGGSFHNYYVIPLFLYIMRFYIIIDVVWRKSLWKNSGCRSYSYVC